MKINDARVKNEFALIDQAIEKVEAYKGDTEIASYLSSFLTVKICGIYEDCIEHLLCKRAERTKDAEVCQYVKATLEQSFRNPKFKRIVEIIGKFSKSYASALKSGIDYKSKTALDSIVDNKNNIAHGKTSNVTISDIRDYHNRCIPIFELLEKVLG